MKLCFAIKFLIVVVLLGVQLIDSNATETTEDSVYAGEHVVSIEQSDDQLAQPETRMDAVVIPGNWSDSQLEAYKGFMVKAGEKEVDAGETILAILLNLLSAGTCVVGDVCDSCERDCGASSCGFLNDIFGGASSVCDPLCTITRLGCQTCAGFVHLWKKVVADSVCDDAYATGDKVRLAIEYLDRCSEDLSVDMFNGVEFKWCDNDRFRDSASGFTVNTGLVLLDSNYQDATLYDLALLLAHEFGHVKQLREKYTSNEFNCVYAHNVAVGRTTKASGGNTIEIEATAFENKIKSQIGTHCAPREGVRGTCCDCNDIYQVPTARFCFTKYEDCPSCIPRENRYNVYIENTGSLDLYVWLQYVTMSMHAFDSAWVDADGDNAWTVRGWYTIRPGESEYLAKTQNRILYIYARSGSSVWEGGEGSVDAFVEPGMRVAMRKLSIPESKFGKSHTFTLGASSLGLTQDAFAGSATRVMFRKLCDFFDSVRLTLVYKNSEGKWNGGSIELTSSRYEFIANAYGGEYYFRADLESDLLSWAGTHSITLANGQTVSGLQKQDTSPPLEFQQLSCPCEPRNCEWGPWSEWTCNEQGYEARSRQIAQQPNFCGALCGGAYEETGDRCELGRGEACSAHEQCETDSCKGGFCCDYDDENCVSCSAFNGFCTEVEYPPPGSACSLVWDCENDCKGGYCCDDSPEAASELCLACAAGSGSCADRPCAFKTSAYVLTVRGSSELSYAQDGDTYIDSCLSYDAEVSLVVNSTSTIDGALSSEGPTSQPPLEFVACDIYANYGKDYVKLHEWADTIDGAYELQFGWTLSECSVSQAWVKGWSRVAVQLGSGGSYGDYSGDDHYGDPYGDGYYGDEYYDDYSKSDRVLDENGNRQGDDSDERVFVHSVHFANGTTEVYAIGVSSASQADAEVETGIGLSWIGIGASFKTQESGKQAAVARQYTPGGIVWFDSFTEMLLNGVLQLDIEALDLEQEIQTSVTQLQNQLRSAAQIKLPQTSPEPFPQQFPSAPTPSATSMPTPSPTATSVPAPTATSLPTPSPTATSMPTPSPTLMSVPGPTATSVSSPTETPDASSSLLPTSSPEPTESPDPSESPEPNQADCFGVSETVVSESRGVISVGSVRVGERILSTDDSGNPEYSAVFLIQHEHRSERRALLNIKHEKGKVIVSKGHFLLTERMHLQAADHFVAGDALMMIESTSKIVGISEVHDRVLNLHTVNGRLVVDGVVASSFSRVKVFGVEVPLPVLRLSLIPVRVLYTLKLHAIASILNEAASRLISHTNLISA